MRFLIVFALIFATVWAKDLYSRSIDNPVLEKEGRIGNGKNASPGKFPYQVGINSNKDTHFSWCSGSFVAQDWVLTSAECVQGTIWARIYLGATERLVAEEFHMVWRSNMTMHPEWDLDTYRNDIGLIRIPKTSETGTIRIVRIPRDDHDKYVGKLAVIAGWGQTGDNYKSLSNDLKYVTLRVSSGFDCSKYFPHIYHDDLDMCVSTSDSMSPCHGDEGGPLVLESENLQIGVFSFGFSKCERGIPAVFTRVGVYAKWIRSHFDL